MIKSHLHIETLTRYKHSNLNRASMHMPSFYYNEDDDDDDEIIQDQMAKLMFIFVYSFHINSFLAVPFNSVHQKVQYNEIPH